MLNVAVQWYVGSWLAGWLVARQRGTVGIMWRTCTLEVSGQLFVPLIPLTLVSCIHTPASLQ